MSKRKRALLFLAGGFVVVILFFTALVFSAATILQTDTVQTQIISVFRRVTGASLTYGAVDIRILPLPQLTLQDVGFEVPGKAKGRIAALTVQPELLPLLQGTVRFSRVNLTSPAFTVELPTAETATTMEDIQQQGASLVRQLIAISPGLEVEVEGGRLDFKGENRSTFPLNDLNFRLALSSKQLEVDGKCAAEAWQSLSFALVLHAEDMSGSGSLQITRFLPAALPALSQLTPGLRIDAGVLDLTSSIEVQGINQARMSLECSADGIGLARGERSVTLGDITFRSALTLDPQIFSVQLQEASLDGLLQKLSGTYRRELATGASQFTLHGEAMNIAESRKVVFALGNDVPEIHSIFDVLQAGEIPSLTVRSTGQTLAELIDPGHLELEGDLIQGTVSIPALDLTFREVAGTVELAHKILSARTVEGALDNHRLHQGDLRIGLSGKGAPFHVAMEVEADVGQLPDLLRRGKMLPDGKLRQVVDSLQDLRGKVVGSVRLGDTLDALTLQQLALSRMEFSVRTKALPFPLAVTGGKLSLDKQGVKGENIAGTLGKSSFSKVAVQIAMAEPYAFTIDRGQGIVVVDEIYPWLSSLEAMKPVLKEVRRASGTLAFSSLLMNGPLLKPWEWGYSVEGEARKCLLDATFLPGKVEEMSGSFRAGPDQLSWQGVRARVADSTLVLSGELGKMAGRFNKAKLSLQGDIGAKLEAWFTKIADLPPALNVRGPITIEKTALAWEEGRGTTISGSMRLGEGVLVSADLQKTKDEVSVRALQIKDTVSDASASISFGKERVEGSFKGRLAAQTLKAILPENPYGGLSLKGDCRFRFPFGDFLRSTLDGTITVTDLSIPWGKEVPLVVQEITLEGAAKKVKVVGSKLLLGDERLTVRGTLAPAAPKLAVDLDVGAEVLDWGLLKRLSRQSAGGGGASSRSLADDLPVRGTVRIRADAFHFNGFSWKPLNADISLQDGTFSIAAKQAALCGISTTGTLAVTAGRAEADIVLAAKGIPFEPTALCLSDQKLDITGLFTLDAHLQGKGPIDRISDWLQGPLTASAKDGRVLRSRLLSNTLNLVNSSEKFQNTLPDLERTAISYRDFAVDGTLQGQLFTLKLGTLASDFVDMSANGQLDLRDRRLQLKALVAPLRTMDRIVQGTPILGRVLGGNLTAVPVTIDGTINDYKVSFLSPSAIGSELLGIIERTVKLPVTIVEPVLP